ncbi:hypothetical protein ARMSODRAFT_62605 [Armillaria solidipes]|uniref:Uncharacterized protein n=1 Tax=Armillaria solidipes TaxID=1076256 RepID=A0A2H3C713_9AGAR|nr:hypothetical protein ARMSODRAFT_62605 [Armillaria solidipes]
MRFEDLCEYVRLVALGLGSLNNLVHIIIQWTPYKMKDNRSTRTPACQRHAGGRTCPACADEILDFTHQSCVRLPRPTRHDASTAARSQSHSSRKHAYLGQTRTSGVAAHSFPHRYPFHLRAVSRKSTSVRQSLYLLGVRASDPGMRRPVSRMGIRQRSLLNFFHVDYSQQPAFLQCLYLLWVCQPRVLREKIR